MILEPERERVQALEPVYRYMDVDYDKGAGSDRMLYQAVFKGPVVQATYAW